MKVLRALLLFLAVCAPVSGQVTIPQPLPFSQNWTDTSLISQDDDWSGVPGMTGYRGDDLTTAIGTNPQTILVSGTNTPIDVNANRSSIGLSSGGVTEFDGIENPTVALQGSVTADAPFILMNLNTTGLTNITVSYNLRDVDSSADDAIQQVALHFRVDTTVDFTDLPAGYVADATTGPHIGTLVTPVSVVLPPVADNRPLVQLRIMTTNAAGSDEWVGIDDILVTSPFLPTNPTGTGTAMPAVVNEGENTLLIVAVTPGTNPPSTGILVSGDLSPIGGPIVQPFFDDGTHGDSTAGDNVFSMLATVAIGTVSGPKTLPVLITDYQLRTGAASISLTVVDTSFVSFSSPLYSVREDSGGAAITVLRTGDSTNFVAVNFNTLDGTATAGLDYAATSGVLLFDPGSMSRTFVVPVFNDTLREGEETVNLVLTAATSGSTIILGSALLRIMDDDSTGPPVLLLDTLVDFGPVSVGQIVMRPVSVRNTGGSPLTFSQPVLVFGSDSGFSITSQPSTLTLGPGQSTSFTVGFQPPFQSYAPFTGMVGMASNAGFGSVPLYGLCIDTIPPTVNVFTPVDGDTLTAGTQFIIQFSGSDNDVLSGFVVSYSTDNGSTFVNEIARTGPNATQVLWNIPDILETTQGRIRVVARDRSGNTSFATSGLFIVRRPITNVPILRVEITFDPPPVGQIAPPQNVEAVATVIPPGSLRLPPRWGLEGGNRSPEVLTVLGYNLYRVPRPPEPLPIPTPEEIVSDSNNLVGSIPADSTRVQDFLSTLRGNLFVYCLTTVYEDGSSSGGSVPAVTTYDHSQSDSAYGWMGPLDAVNAPWYPYPSVDAARLSVTPIVPPGSPEGNRSLKFAVTNRGTNFSSFAKVFGQIQRPYDLTGLEIRLKKVGSSPILRVYVDMMYNGDVYSTSASPFLSENTWQTVVLNTDLIPDTSVAEIIVFGITSYGDSCQVYVDYMKFLGTGGYVFETMGDTLVPPRYLTLTPDTMVAKDPLRWKLLKPVRRKKGLYPNWANLLQEVVVQGGFQPGATESDSAGGMRLGISSMMRTSPNPLRPKWKPVPDSADVRAWARLTKWDFRKYLGKTYGNLRRTLEDKTGMHVGQQRGFDTYTVSGSGVKVMFGQRTLLYPRRHNNRLYAELVALKFNIAASQLAKTPAGFGELVFDVDGNPCDELSVVEIAAKADTAMTYWQGRGQSEYDSLCSAISRINRAFVGKLDTLRFEQDGQLSLKGAVDLYNVPFMKEGGGQPRRLTPTTLLTEDPGEFDDEDFDDGEGVPPVARLYQNYPNPFNPITTIGFRLREPSLVTLRVYSVLGQEVTTLVRDEEFDEGYQTVEFIGNNLASGVYFYRAEIQSLETGELAPVVTNKMLLLK